MQDNYDDLGYRSTNHASDRRTNWFYALIALAIAVLVACGGDGDAASSESAVSASAASDTTAQQAAVADQSQSAPVDGVPADGAGSPPEGMENGELPGGMAGGMGGMFLGANLEVDKYIAEALGTTEEALQAARTEAITQTVNAAVLDGTMTQEQADAMLSGPQGGGMPGGAPPSGDAQMQPPTDGLQGQPTDGAQGQPPAGNGEQAAPEGGAGNAPGGGFGMRNLDTSAALASILGVTEDQLLVAEEYAYEAAVAAAVADGTMTQEDADLMLAQRALQRASGVEQGSDWATRVQSALGSGAITQAQADLLLANEPQFAQPESTPPQQ